MAADAINRKLVAILYADVAGYSRLTEEDEEGTHRRVLELLDFASTQIDETGGKVLRYAGDAILAEFASVVTAVNTACRIQTELAAKNQPIDENKRVQLRIGINIGDVIEDRGEVYGDGVNLAARLEAAAPEGGICISASVHDQIDGKIDFEFSDDGEETFKNIQRPVSVFRWQPTGDGDLNAKESVRKGSEKPSIAVLALTNMSNDPEQDFIGDGITEDLITALSKIRSFKVISRESTFSYKDSSVDIRQIAKDLDVKYVLEGSVRKSGSRVRVTAQLIDADTGHHVWAERYDREMEDIFDLQDEMVQIIASALEPELNAFERERAVSKPPGNLDAWELYQRALWYMWTYEDEANKTAMAMFKQASEADLTFAPAHAYFAYSCYITVIMGYAENPESRLQEGLVAGKKALKCDDKDAISHFAIARIQMMLGNHEDSIASLEKAIELNPCFAQSYHGLGFALTLAGELEEAKRVTRKAIEMSPRDPMLWAFLAVHSITLVLNGENEAAFETIKKTMRLPNATGYWNHAMMAATLGNLGRIEEARAALEIAKQENPGFSIEFVVNNMPTRFEGGLDPYLDGLRKAGLE